VLADMVSVEDADLTPISAIDASGRLKLPFRIFFSNLDRPIGHLERLALQAAECLACAVHRDVVLLQAGDKGGAQQRGYDGTSLVSPFVGA